MRRPPDRENRESPRLRAVPAADPTPLTPSVAAAIEARLDALQVESEQRRRELREIAAALPQATSRRLLVTQMTRELRQTASPAPEATGFHPIGPGGDSTVTVSAPWPRRSTATTRNPSRPSSRSQRSQ